MTTSKQNTVLLKEIRASRDENRIQLNLIADLVKKLNEHAEVINRHEEIIQDQWARIEELEDKLKWYDDDSCKSSPEILIKGLPLNIKIDYWSIIEKLQQKIGFQGHPRSVIYDTRAFPSTKDKDGADTFQCFVISLVSDNVLNKILQLRKKHEKITYLDLLSEDKLKNQVSETQVNVSKLHSSAIFKLLNATIKTAKPLGYKYVWAGSNCVKIRKDDTSQIFNIYSAKDIQLIK